jgi:hypothetical protein
MLLHRVINLSTNRCESVDRGSVGENRSKGKERYYKGNAILEKNLAHGYVCAKNTNCISSWHFHPVYESS